MAGNLLVVSMGFVAGAVLVLTVLVMYALAQAFSSASADPVSSNQTGVVILTIYNPHRG
jgi:uncharacterized membrane protein YdcZ (DUF606 family)